MGETNSTEASATTATVRLRSDLFDERCRDLGAETEVARAALVEVSRVTLHRFRKGEMAPRLEVAMRFANRLNMTVEELWEQVA